MAVLLFPCSALRRMQTTLRNLTIKFNIMKKQNLANGKKLIKKELRVITGGKEMCWLPELVCSKISFSCAEPQCQPSIEIE